VDTEAICIASFWYAAITDPVHCKLRVLIPRIYIIMTQKLRRHWPIFEDLDAIICFLTLNENNC
jgi:hypothetical protein